MGEEDDCDDSLAWNRLREGAVSGLFCRLWGGQLGRIGVVALCHLSLGSSTCHFYRSRRAAMVGIAVEAGRGDEKVDMYLCHGRDRKLDVGTKFSGRRLADTSHAP
jgi:hypothetical protein